MKTKHAKSHSASRSKAIGALVTLRLESNLLAQIDSWRARQQDRPSRPEAVRRLVAEVLAGSNRTMSKSGRSGRRSEIARMAGRQLDLLGDSRASRKERATRKQRLLKGPKEFRRIRNDL
jgi:hypothetical protein